jgi:hypothetical protein
MAERTTAKPLCKDIPKLVLAVNLVKNNVTGANLFAKPMVFDGIVFGTRSHALRFQTAEIESTNIVFIDGGVEVRSFGDWETDSLAKFVDLVE